MREDFWNTDFIFSSGDPDISIPIQICTVLHWFSLSALKKEEKNNGYFLSSGCSIFCDDKYCHQILFTTTYNFVRLRKAFGRKHKYNELG